MKPYGYSTTISAKLNARYSAEELTPLQHREFRKWRRANKKRKSHKACRRWIEFMDALLGPGKQK